MRVLVTRPADVAARTAARLEAAGHTILFAPLLELHAEPWIVPEPLPEAVAFTSAAAARLGGAGLAPLLALPAFAVGAATAAAVRAAGFTDVRVLGGHAAALFASIAASGFARVLHLAGADHINANVPGLLGVEVRTVYAASLAEMLSAPVRSALAAGEVDLVLLYSPRTAGRFADLVASAGLDRSRLRIAAISPAATLAAGSGWAATIAAPCPTEASLFAAAGLVCDRGAREDDA